MDVRLLRLLIAAPLVALLGVAMALAAAPDGDLTARDREVVARLTRGGVQRFDADGGHWAPDVTDAVVPGLPSSTTGPLLLSAPASLGPRVDAVVLLVPPAVGTRGGRPSAPPERGRAPPRR